MKWLKEGGVVRAGGLPDSFSTDRPRAERLSVAHWDAIRAMDADPVYMALLGGPRTEDQTRAYMDRNLEHWNVHGFGLWILRDTHDQIIGRGAIRHLDVEGTDKWSSATASIRRTGAGDSPPKSRGSSSSSG